jgi:hypothetical protein
MDSETKHAIDTQSAELRSSVARWFGLPLVALLAALWFAPSIAGTTDVVSQLSEPSSAWNGLVEKGMAVLAADPLVRATDRAAEWHNHRDQSAHGSYGCDGIDCSGVANLALRDIRPSPPGPPPTVKSDSSVDHLAQPPLRPPRSAV